LKPAGPASRLVWFAALWGAGVLAVTIIGLIIKLMLGA
jgi:hypothetical protein